MKPSVPSFSVVIPAYDSAEFIGDAVESALQQTLAAHEVIVCNDGSTDDLAGALARFRGRIVLLDRPHRGAAAARNDAIRAASGEFVAMLDADDAFEPDRLAALGELASARPDLDILASDAYFHTDGCVTGRFYEYVEFAAGRQDLAILDRCFVAWPAMRRERVLAVGGFDESPQIAPSEDWELFIRLILDGAKVGIVERPLLRYRRHPTSMTANRVRALRSRVAVLEKVSLREDLTVEQRQQLERLLVRGRSRAVLCEARSLPATRRTLLASARRREISPVARLTLAVAALAPRRARPLLALTERRVARG
jgi:glycosyltransferase involved in cell wall biosynthesis